jgi:UDP-glucose 6-dehydrogenase
LAYRNPDTFFIVVDSNKDRIDAWNSGLPPLYEPGLANLLALVKIRADHRELCVESQCANNPVNHYKPYNAQKDYNCLEEKAVQKEARKRVTKRYPNLAFSTNIDKAIMSSEMVIIAVNTLTKVTFSFLLAVVMAMFALTKRCAIRKGNLGGISGALIQQ